VSAQTRERARFHASAVLIALKTRELECGTRPALLRDMSARTHYVLRILATAAIATAYFFPHS
jgi:hypothetical protein